jgi:hypothetical protein
MVHLANGFIKKLVNIWFVRTPWDSSPFPEIPVAGAAQLKL